jgi:hypothetical protein
MLKLWRRFHYLIRQRRTDTELAEEMEFHRAMEQQRLERTGVDYGEAAFASRRVLGNVALAREDARGVWIMPWLQSVWQDGAYAVRIVRRSPAFAVAMILVMGLGIGATTGVFSILDALVLRSLPVREPDRLVFFAKPGFSYRLFTEVQARSSHIFSDFFAWNMERVNVEWTNELEPTEVLMASGEFYATLGVTAVAGRVFGPEDDRIGGGLVGPSGSHQPYLLATPVWRRPVGHRQDRPNRPRPLHHHWCDAARLLRRRSGSLARHHDSTHESSGPRDVPHACGRLAPLYEPCPGRADDSRGECRAAEHLACGTRSDY